MNKIYSEVSSKSKRKRNNSSEVLIVLRKREKKEKRDSERNRVKEEVENGDSEVMKTNR